MELDRDIAGRAPTTSEVAFDVERLREDFPALGQIVHGKPLAYLDNAATTQKPKALVDRMTRAYFEECANVHRAVHALAERATEAYEDAREKVRSFIGAAEPSEIVFTRGTTEAVNLVAQTFGRARVGRGDEVVVSQLEHHSNLVPWQMLCRERGARLVVIPMNARGELRLEELERRISLRTRLVAVGHVSNAIGTVNPIDRIIEIAHARRVPVLVDGAQAVAHRPVDVRALDCELYAFSGHKMYGPTGIGVLYGKRSLLEDLPPWQGGGDMVLEVTFDESSFAPLPQKYEAGTPNVAGAIGLGAAIDYVRSVGWSALWRHERMLMERALAALRSINGVRIIGDPEQRSSVISFVIDRVHPHDAATILDRAGIAVRAGHHCAQPAMAFFGVPATLRASFAVYNTDAEIDRLVAALHDVRKVFLS